MRVLIIEDDDGMREEYESFLGFETDFCDTHSVSHGQDALNYLRRLGEEELPEVIVLDIGLPVMNGFEFREAQLADPKLRNITVVVITGSHWTAEDQARLRPDYYLQKPFRVSELEKVMREIVGRKKTARMSALTKVGIVRPLKK